MTWLDSRARASVKGSDQMYILQDNIQKFEKQFSKLLCCKLSICTDAHVCTRMHMHVCTLIS